MALTRPTVNQINTTVTSIIDPITVLNKNSTLANVDIGFIMNRNGGTSANAAIYWDESANSFVTAFTTSAGLAFANIVIGEFANLQVNTLVGNTSGNSVTVSYVLGNSNDITIKGNLVPSANITYDLGSPTNRWRVGYFAANTLDLVGGTISVDPTYGFTFTTATQTIQLSGANSVTANVETLFSNAAFQSGQIASTESNIGIANTAMKGYVDGQISSVTSAWQSNAAVQAGNIATLFSNAAVQAGLIHDLYTIKANLASPTFTGTVSGATAAFTGPGYFNELYATQSSGDEGGQINLAPAVTNTTLVGNVVIDVYQNRLRIFEGGGTNRGGYYDIAGLAAGVGTNLAAGGGGGTPGGSDGQVQFNDSSAFGGAGSLYYYKGNSTVLVSGGVASTTTTSGALQIAGGVGITGNINANYVRATAFTYANGVSILDPVMTAWQANAAVQAGDIATLYANAGAQAGTLATLTSNAAVQAGDIATLFANAGAQSGQIVSANTAMKGYVDSTVSTANTAMKGYVDSVDSTKAPLASPSFTGNVSITGNLFVSGNVSVYNTNNLSISDGLIYLAENNSGNVIDLGITVAWTDAVRYQHGGIVRDATDGVWKFFGNVVPEPTTTVDFTNATYDDIRAGNVTFNRIRSTSTTQSTGTTSGALIVDGGAGIAANLHVGGNVVINDLTNAIPYVMGSGAFHVAGGASFGKDVWMGGDLYVANIVSETTSILVVNEPLVYLRGNVVYPYNYDIGIYSDFTGGPANVRAYTGLVRNDTDSRWYLFSNIAEPTNGIVNVNDTNIIFDELLLGKANIKLTTASTNTTTGALVVAGGAGIAGNVNAGNVSATNLTGTVQTAAQPSITSLGNLSSLATSGTISAVGQVRANSGIASTSTTTGALTVIGGVGIAGNVNAGNVSATNLTGTIQTAAQPSITSLGTLTSLAVQGTSTMRAIAAEANNTYNIGAVGTVFANGYFTNLFGTLQTAAQTNITSVGTLTGLTVSSAIVPNANATVNLGSTSAYWNVVYAKTVNADTFSGISTRAQYADLAEVYTSDRDYIPGTVVVFGGAKEVTVSTESHDPSVAGVVSTNPAYLMNSDSNGVAVALQGRVPTKVKGPVKKGDRLVSSDVQGAAERLDMTLYQPGCIIGKALEDIEDDSIQTIEVVVGRV